MAGSKQLKRHIPHILVVISVVISTFIFKGEGLPTFLSFILLLPIFVYFKDGRIPVGYAILMLLLAAFALSLKNEALANLFAIYAYWLLVVGVVCLFIEYVREEREEAKEGSAVSRKDGGEER